jgi:Holliday junction resolvase RusA-like endonuclease
MPALVITIRGKAEAAGSKRGFVRGGRVQIVDANPNAKSWKAQVRDTAAEALARAGRMPLIPGPLFLDVVEYRVRPQGHYTTTGNLSAEGRRKPFPTSAPDRGKTLRALEDALSGVLYFDDSQVVDGRVAKRWGSAAQTVVIVARALDHDDMLDRWHQLQALETKGAA